MLAGLIIVVVLFCYLFPKPIRDGFLAFVGLIMLVAVFSGDDKPAPKAEAASSPPLMVGASPTLPGGGITIPAPSGETAADNDGSIDPSYPKPPYFDVETACRERAETSVAPNAGAKSKAQWIGACLDSAQSAYDLLVSEWDLLPLTSRISCARVGYDRIARGDWGAYNSMEACASAELIKQQNETPTRHFAH